MTAKEKKLSFEDAMRQLEETVEKLACEDTPLDEMMELYERGITLYNYLRRTLEDYEGKLLTLDPDKKTEES